MVTSLTDLAAGAAINTNNQTSRLSSLLTAAASGTRITRALDDIASLSAATSLSSEVSGLRSAALNVAQAGSFLEVADGGLEQIGALLDRAAQLSTQANNGALNDSAREGINTEFQQILEEIDRLAGETNFNGVNLLDGSLSSEASLRTAPDIEAGDVSARGSINDSLIAGGVGTISSARITFVGEADIAAGNTISISDGDGGAVDFEFVAGAPAVANEIQIGGDLEETLENAAAAINTFSGANDEGVSQLDVRIDGNALVFEGRQPGDVLGDDGVTPITIATDTAGNLDNVSFDNGEAAGIDVRNVSAESFAGQINGFEADFTGNDQVNLSVRVGDETFRASGLSTNNADDQTVTFTSENGGSFDITFAGGQGQQVRDGAEADQFAARLDSAFANVRFTQNREVTNFTAVGDLAGAQLELDASSFEGVEFVRAAVLNGRLEVQIGDQTFRSIGDLNDYVGFGEPVLLLAENGDQLNFVNGQTRFDISNQAGADAFAQRLNEAFGATDTGAAFQVSAGADGTLQLGIGDATKQGLGLQNLNLLSADSAATAFGAVGAAISTVTSQRADVGAFQQALDFAANNIEVVIQNQEAARSSLVDADLAAFSTEFSLLDAAREASINTQAQTNRLAGNLLQLIE